jgi:hypothetical protein
LQCPWDRSYTKGGGYDWRNIIAKFKSFSRERIEEVALCIVCQHKETVAFEPKFCGLHPSLSISRLEDQSTFIAPSENEPGDDNYKF